MSLPANLRQMLCDQSTCMSKVGALGTGFAKGTGSPFNTRQNRGTLTKQLSYTKGTLKTGQQDAVTNANANTGGGTLSRGSLERLNAVKIT